MRNKNILHIDILQQNIDSYSVLLLNMMLYKVDKSVASLWIFTLRQR